MNLEKDHDTRLSTPGTTPSSPEPTTQSPESESPSTQPTPPSPKREFGVEEEWAETLGMSFDPEEAERRSAPVPPPFRPRQQGPGMPLPGQQPADRQPRPDELPPIRPEVMPKTFLVWSILATICCCLPAGIVAIIFSASVSSKYYAADYEGARRASRNAEIWIIVSIVAGIITNALYLPLTLLMPQ